MSFQAFDDEASRFFERVLFERQLTLSEQQQVSHHITDMRDRIRDLEAVANAAQHLAGDLDRRWSAGHPHRVGHLDPLLAALEGLEP